MVASLIEYRKGQYHLPCRLCVGDETSPLSLEIRRISYSLPSVPSAFFVKDILGGLYLDKVTGGTHGKRTDNIRQPDKINDWSEGK